MGEGTRQASESGNDMHAHIHAAYNNAGERAREVHAPRGRSMPWVFLKMPQALQYMSPVSRSLRHSGVLVVPQL